MSEHTQETGSGNVETRRRDYQPPAIESEEIFTAVSAVCTRVQGCGPDPEGEIPFPQS